MKKTGIPEILALVSFWSFIVAFGLCLGILIGTVISPHIARAEVFYNTDDCTNADSGTLIGTALSTTGSSTCSGKSTTFFSTDPNAYIIIVHNETPYTLVFRDPNSADTNILPYGSYQTEDSWSGGDTIRFGDPADDDWSNNSCQYGEYITPGGGVLTAEYWVFADTSVTDIYGTAGRISNVGCGGLNNQNGKFSGMALLFNPGFNPLYPYLDLIVTPTPSASLCGSASTTPCYSQDSGNLSFGLAILIGFASLAFIGWIFNSMTRKKEWK